MSVDCDNFEITSKDEFVVVWMIEMVEIMIPMKSLQSLDKQESATKWISHCY